jgi:ferric-dicitrate binding protein FerR (iron transport regulator)
MVRTREEIEELIACYLNGEATPEQAMELEDWKAESADNGTLYSVLENVYNLTQNTTGFQSPDIEKAWRNVKLHIKEETKAIPIWRNSRVWLSVAAVALLAFLLGRLFNNNENPQENFAEGTDKEIVTPLETVLLASEKVESFTLEDQSKVELEKGSRLVLDADFNTNGRSATLHGSGTFEVIHDESSPFIISVEGLQVIDVGTVFNIDTRGDTIKIVVDEGAVELRLNGKTLDIVEGDSAFYVISDQVIARYKSPGAEQDHIFEFDGTNLEEVASVLGKFFERKIVVMDHAIAKCPLSVTFRNESLATILDIIKELLDVKIVRNKDIIGIYGEGCN